MDLIVFYVLLFHKPGILTKLSNRLHKIKSCENCIRNRGNRINATKEKALRSYVQSLEGKGELSLFTEWIK
jgi:hypothetical protein